MSGMGYSGMADDTRVGNRFRELLDELRDVVSFCGVGDCVRIDETLLGKAVIDYFEDIDRLKEFEEIPRTNVSKIYSYQAYWLMKRHPIQIVDPSRMRERHLYINEIACAAILISKMYAEAGIRPGERNDRRIVFFNLLYYNLKYRLYTQQSLELMTEAFFFGQSVT